MATCSRSERPDASSAHFSAAFRDMFGMTPPELLKTLQPVQH
jgi:AraC-like DNA-binding protein